jgi:hypothetical protein
VTKEDGEPLVGYAVHLQNGIFGHQFGAEHTDSDGWAEFSSDYIDDDADVHVDTIYVTLTWFPHIITVTLDEDCHIDDGETMSYTVADSEWE